MDSLYAAQIGEEYTHEDSDWGFPKSLTTVQTVEQKWNI